VLVGYVQDTLLSMQLELRICGRNICVAAVVYMYMIYVHRSLLHATFYKFPSFVITPAMRAKPLKSINHVILYNPSPSLRFSAYIANP
jgi:hypothetical protein